MAACPTCGHENRDRARFCDACGARLAPAEPERRKLATLLFCDMSGSTAMGERVDAESVREMMFAYFHEMRGAIERHGGTVEKFIGDAVMAVFGVPVAHEDDALRAVRAAWEMQQRLAGLNEELLRSYGSRIALRIGVNTGEVVAGDPVSGQALVTGDAVNVAARLEQAASPGEVLLGEPTFRLVRDAVSAEPVEPLVLKGKSEPLAAYRLTDVDSAAPARARRLDTPIVGRREELAFVRSTLDEAAAGRCLLATVVGEPGVGKSRLAAELLASAEPAFRVLSGRCLQYGEGITYWPIAEIVHQAAGVRDEHSREEALERIEALAPGDVGATVAQAIGLADGEAGTDEIARAIAGLLGSLARERALLMFVDDIQWAEPVLLELLSSLPARLAGAPLLLLCLTRPELLDDRPEWKVTVRLQPLEEADSALLVEQLLGEASLPAGLAERVAAAAAGNPLFVEELVGMLVDDGLLRCRNGSWEADPGLAELSVPPTLRELLGARLDRMPPGERAALERGAVEGQVFHRGAVVALSEESDEPAVGARLQALLEREYLRPARADFLDEAAYRVRHILIRDAAYDAIPKKLRVSLHERFAAWLEAKAGDRVTEYEELLGYHLEQAYRYLEALGPVDERGLAVAGRAAERLGAAGLRASTRLDIAAAGLLRRAASLLPAKDATRLEYLQEAAQTLAYADQTAEVHALLDVVLDEANAAGLRHLAARARLLACWVALSTEHGYGGDRFLADTAEAELVFREFGDDQGLARVHDVRAFIYDWRRQSTAVEREAALGIEHARRAGNRRLELEHMWWLLWQLPQGPTPVEDAIKRCHELHEQLGGDVAAESAFLDALGELEAMRGRFDDARALVERSVELRTGLGLHGLLLATGVRLAAIELMAGELGAAERVLDELFDDPVEATSHWVAAEAGPLLAELLLAQGRLDEADQRSAEAERAALPGHVAMQVRWRCARAKVLACRGDLAGAKALAREAVELAGGTDDLNLQGRALLSLAEATGDQVVATDAVERFRRKGNVASAGAAELVCDRLAGAA